MNDLAFVFKSMFRNSRRGFLTLASLVLAVAILISAESFMSWLLLATRDGGIWNWGAHIEVSQVGYRQKGAAYPQKYLIEAPDIQKIKNIDPQIIFVKPLLIVSGMVAYNGVTVPFVGYGSDYIGFSELVLKKVPRLLGISLFTDSTFDVMLGEGLFNTLEASSGKPLVLMGKTKYGGFNAVEANIINKFTSPNADKDSLAIKAPIKLLQNLFLTDKVHKWQIYVDDVKETQRVLKKIKKNFSHISNLEYKSWDEINEFYTKTVELFGKQLGVLRILMVIVIILGIANLFMMNVLERTKEIGTLLALGFRRQKILKLFVYEGLLWGVLGAIFGVTVGIVICEIGTQVGIPMPPAPGMNHGFEAGLTWTAQIIIRSSLICLFSTFIASLLPAWKASRQNITEALAYK